MFNFVSKNKGFVKLTKENIKYIVSEKKFAEMQKDGLIKGDKPVKIKAQTPDLSPADSSEVVTEDLSSLKKDDLVEIARRLGFEGEVTIATTKVSLIEFINSKKV
jgi:hypothetical protein